MSNPNYTLEIISHHPKFANKSLRKYYVDGIETVGAWGDEPFEIRFKNNTWQKIQVKLSLDGTDVLTGEPATTEVSDKMWVVNGYGTLDLKAWPETNNGGASFIFTSANNSVAVHTHGNLSSRGIIAAAVYTEGYVVPVQVPPRVDHHHHYHRGIYDYYYGSPVWIGGGRIGSAGTIINVNDSFSLGDSVTVNSVYTANLDSKSSASNSLDCSVQAAADQSLRSRSENIESLVSVGAGQHVDQHITYVNGLIKPMFSETIRVKYLWWDDLVAKLKENNVSAPHPSGFPGDKNPVMSIGKTPRIGSFKTAFPRAQVQPEYSRI